MRVSSLAGAGEKAHERDLDTQNTMQSPRDALYMECMFDVGQWRGE